jgi:hypothetical protein
MPTIALSSKRVFSERRQVREEITRCIAEALSTSKFLQIAKTYQELRSSLDACATLADNWDSYGAAKPATHSIEAAGRFLRSFFTALFTPSRMPPSALFMPSRVIPSAEGGVAVYFNNDNKTAYVEYRNSKDVILAMFDDLSDPIIVELTEDDADESRAVSLIRSYITS